MSHTLHVSVPPIGFTCYCFPTLHARSCYKILSLPSNVAMLNSILIHVATAMDASIHGCTLHAARSHEVPFAPAKCVLLPLHFSFISLFMSVPRQHNTAARNGVKLPRQGTPPLPLAKCQKYTF
eukprot:5517550-Amphidinium_carterae.3